MIGKYKKESWWWILGIFCACVIVLWPLASRGFFLSDDGEWMIIRLSAFFQSLRDGQFPVRFLGRLNYGYGYPVANFLYPGFLYAGSVIHILGFSFTNSTKILFVSSVAWGAIWIFLWLRKRFEAIPSFLGSVSFIGAPYLLYDIYTRGSVGEVFAFLAVAFSLYAIESNVWFVPLAICILILSHNSLALLFMTFLVVYIIYQRHINMLPLVLLGIGMSAFFWLPALWERQYVLFDMIKISDSLSYFVTGRLVALIGGTAILTMILALVVIKKRTHGFNLFFVTWVGSVFFSLPVSFFIWKNDAFARLFQFPYRFLSLGIIAQSWLTAYVFQYVSQKHRKSGLILFTVVWIFSFSPFIATVRHVMRPEIYYTTNEATTTVADEYLPRWIQEKPRTHPEKKLELFSGKGTIQNLTATSRQVRATLQITDPAVIQINTIYYPGWGVTIDDHPEPIYYDNPLGLIRIFVPQGTHHLFVEFRETVLRFLSDIISLLSFIAYIVYFFIWMKQLYQGKHKRFI